MEGHFVERIAAIRKVYACQRNYTLPILSITSRKKFILFYWPFIHTSKEVLSCTTVKAAVQKFPATKLAMRDQASGPPAKQKNGLLAKEVPEPPGCVEPQR